MKRVFIVRTALLFTLIAWGMADYAHAYTVYQLTDNEINDGSAYPSVNAGGQVVWIGDDQVFLSYGLEILQLTDDDDLYRGPQINDSGWLYGTVWRAFSLRSSFMTAAMSSSLNETVLVPNYESADQ